MTTPPPQPKTYGPPRNVPDPDEWLRELDRNRRIGFWSGMPVALGGLALLIVLAIGFIDLSNYRAAQQLYDDGVTYEVTQVREYVTKERHRSTSSDVYRVEVTYVDDRGVRQSVRLRNHSDYGPARRPGWYTTFPRPSGSTSRSSPDEVVVSASHPDIAMWSSDVSDAANKEHFRSTLKFASVPAVSTLLGILGLHVRHVRIRRRQDKPWGKSLALFFLASSAALTAWLALSLGAGWLLLASSL